MTTTTGTCRPSAAPHPLLMALLTALLLAAIAVTPVLADSSEPPPTNGSVISPVPEPGTLLFVGIAGTALFIRRRERCLR